MGVFGERNHNVYGGSQVLCGVRWMRLSMVCESGSSEDFVDEGF